MCSNVYDDVTDFLVLQFHQKQKIIFWDRNIFFKWKNIPSNKKNYSLYIRPRIRPEYICIQLTGGKKFSPAKLEKDFSRFLQCSCTVYSLFLPFEYVFDPLPLLRLLLAKTITYIGIKSCTLLICQMSHTMKGS